MIRRVKNLFYFTVARYFRFFARIRLRRWNPRVVVITGSNGKTMALHLAEVQLGARAKYSHLANSAYGVPFDILGLKRTSFLPQEWLWLFLRAPLYAFRAPYAEKIYVVEADCDRPGEGNFLGSLLKPEVCVWLSTARTHSMLFEKVVSDHAFASLDEAIAYEFGCFIAQASTLAIVNADSVLIEQQIPRTHASVYEIRERALRVQHTVTTGGTEFTIRDTVYRTPHLLPKETLYAIESSVKLAEYFGVRPTSDLSKLVVPPGRSSLFRGLKKTTIVDSSYNANVESVAAIVRMAERLHGEKWLILGDLTEQGRFEKEEHERIAHILAKSELSHVISVGPRTRAFLGPVLAAEAPHILVESFIGPKEALDYLISAIEGGEILVFKGARFLEGIIEHLLEDKADVAKLCRREPIWQTRRKQWGL